MSKFEDLPENIRALILAKLAREMNAHRCATFGELANKKHSDVLTMWRGICRMAGQPTCTMPSVLAAQR